MRKKIQYGALSVGVYMRICRGSLKYTEKECTPEGHDLCPHYIPHTPVFFSDYYCECNTKLCHMTDHVKVKYRRVGPCTTIFEIDMLKAIQGRKNARPSKSKKKH
jgi:hypothetical protein